MPIRVLFFKDPPSVLGPDVGVHLMLMSHFAPNEVEVFVVSNSEAADADDMRVRLAGMPNVSSAFLPREARFCACG